MLVLQKMSCFRAAARYVPLVGNTLKEAGMCSKPSLLLEMMTVQDSFDLVSILLFKTTIIVFSVP